MKVILAICAVLTALTATMWAALLLVGGVEGALLCLLAIFVTACAVATVIDWYVTPQLPERTYAQEPKRDLLDAPMPILDCDLCADGVGSRTVGTTQGELLHVCDWCAEEVARTNREDALWVWDRAHGLA